MHSLHHYRYLPLREVYLSQLMNLHCYIRKNPKSLVYIVVYSWYCVFYGFGNYVRKICHKVLTESFLGLP